MHLHVTLNRIVMLHNFVTPNILSHVPKIIQNIQKYTPTAFQITRMKYFFAQAQFILLIFSTGHTASSVSSLKQTPQQPKSMQCRSVLELIKLMRDLSCSLSKVVSFHQAAHYQVTRSSVMCHHLYVPSFGNKLILEAAKLFLEMKAK